MTTTIGGTTGITFPDATTQNTSPYTGGLAFRNRIINGAMVIDQRNAGAAQNSLAAAKVYLVDRFWYYGSQAGKFNSQQNAGSVTPPAGFTNYLGLTVASAVTPGAADQFLLVQQIEGFNVTDLAFGTANAKTVTLSFYVYTSVTGTHSGTISNGSLPAYPFTFTVSSANTWTPVSVTIAGCTSGTWNTGNGNGMQVNFNLGCGSNSLGTAGAWDTSASRFGATGSVSIVSNAGATFYITGVQLEKGSTATSFDYRPYGTELALCQRYYSKIVADSSYTGFANGYLTTTTQLTCVLTYPQTMRALPTASISNCGVVIGAGSVYPASLGGIYYGKNSANASITFTGGSGIANSGGLLAASNNTAAYIDYSAEL